MVLFITLKRGIFEKVGILKITWFLENPEILKSWDFEKVGIFEKSWDFEKVGIFEKSRDFENCVVFKNYAVVLPRVENG